MVLTGLGAGTYFIRVFLFGGGFNGYELAVLVTCGSSIHGQKWNDLNGNGFWDDNEPGLDGFLIELRDPFTGQPVAIPNNPQETHSVDLDDNGVIDPQLEQGWFLVRRGAWRLPGARGATAGVGHDLPIASGLSLLFRRG